MTRKSLLFLATFLIVSSSVSAQNWEFVGVFPPDSSLTSATQGVAVDAAGKVWVDQTYETPVLDEDSTTLFVSAPLHVFNPDGTRPWDPIHVIEGDTLKAFVNRETGSARYALAFISGVKSDHNGDIIVTLRRTGQNLGSKFVRFDHKTGEIKNSIVLGDDANTPYSQPVSPGIDENGNIYIGQVVSRGRPIGILSPEFGFLGLVTDAAPGIARNLEVTADGNSVYWPDAVGTAKPGLAKFTRADEFSPFTSQFNPADTTGLLHEGLRSESSSRDPRTGYIWFGNGSDHTGSLGSRSFSSLTWYAVDPASDEIVDSLSFNLSEDESLDNPLTRAMGFSPDGMEVYVGIYNTGIPALQKFKYVSPTNIQRDPVEIPDGFTLSQNYPNPFNPQTNIEFEMRDAGLASLKVYDLLGREVATLVDEHLVAGKYTATFNATDLPSGSYVYQLDVAGNRLSGKMTLVK
ncbi:MAG: T9SS type A sorting domain-containing protein [Bacteroidetes bacterium]|nr:T9SS type A sorting domain-containing protein [Bacteroidota bacterium]